MTLNWPKIRQPQAFQYVTAAYVASLLVLGGGGSPAPLSELACQVLAALMLLIIAVLKPPFAPIAPRLAWIVIGLLTIVPLLQLVPLPPTLWHNLPGRELVRDSLDLVGASNNWRPLAIAPQRTLDALLAMLPPLVALMAVSSLGPQGRDMILRTVAIMGLASIAIGALQLAGDGHGFWYFYGPTEQTSVLGFQANRNAEADVLLIAMIALVAGWIGWIWNSRSGLIAIAVLATLLVLGTILTGSRTGVMLVPVAGVWVVWLVTQGQEAPALRLRPWQWVGLGIAIAGLAALAWQTRAVGRVIARFSQTGEYRPDIWRDTLHAIGTYWPAGSGLGSFSRAIGPAERLEAIGAVLPNRAHNEYLELLLEGGLPMAVCWLVAAALIVVATVRALRRDSTFPAGHAVFAAGTIAVVALHALVDYPFRSVALASLVAVAAALVIAPPGQAKLKPITRSNQA